MHLHRIRSFLSRMAWRFSENLHFLLICRIRCNYNTCFARARSVAFQCFRQFLLCCCWRCARRRADKQNARIDQRRMWHSKASVLCTSAIHSLRPILTMSTTTSASKSNKSKQIHWKSPWERYRTEEQHDFRIRCDRVRFQIEISSSASWWVSVGNLLF